VELIGSTKFRWLGRKDFVINSGGIKLHPEEIESKLSKSIQVPFFVSGLQDERLGEKLVLHVEQDSPISITKSEFSTILGKHQIPKEIYYYSTFQFTKSGKIDRLATIKKSTSVAREVL
jgi:O-succinylbenzoic acid--CoA ligase